MKRLFAIVVLCALCGCTRTVGPLQSGATRADIRKAFGEPRARVTELTGDNEELCLTLGNKRPQLVERWTYIIAGADDRPHQIMDIYFNPRGELLATLTAPASQPPTTQP